MAIINSVLGNMKGKLGNLSTRKTLGQNIIYARAQEVANPRTASQMAQRVKLANVVVTYRVLRQFLEAYAFENKPAKRSVYNEFVALNLNSNKIYLTKDAVKAGACVVAPYVISKGTLGMIGVQGYGTGAVTDLAVESTSFANATIGEFAQDLLANNPRLKAGDQLSYVSLIQSTGADGFPHVVCQIYEVILNPESTTPLADYFPTRAIAVTDGHLAHSAEAITGAFAWVLSRKENGKVRVSTQSLVLSGAEVGNAFTDINKAIASYGSSDVPFLDPDVAGGAGEGSAMDTPAVASATQGSTNLSWGMKNVSLSASPAVTINGSNFENGKTYKGRLEVNAQVQEVAATRVSDTQITLDMTGHSVTSSNTWELYLMAGSYKLKVASSAPGGGFEG